MKYITACIKMATFSSHYIVLAGLFVFANGLSSDGSYHQTIMFPYIGGKTQGFTQYITKPILPSSIRYYVNPAPSLGLPPFSSPANTKMIISGIPNQNPSYRRLMPTFNPPKSDLFLPNTIKQPVQSRAQYEEYKKYIKEVAEEDEKERNLNSVGFDSHPGFETTGYPTTSSFVKLHVKGKDYSYST